MLPATAATGPSVADVLRLDPVRHGRPRVAAGAQGLGRPVRWTHVAEVLDISHLLQGGELLLSTGVAFPDGHELVVAVRVLAQAGTAGLLIELGRRYDEIPGAVLEVADEVGFPVVELRRETSFVQVTEAVHALVLGAQVAELRASEEVHRTFTELSMEGANPETIVRHTARMARAPVVLENLAHQVLAFDPAGTSADVVLDRWEARSRALTPQGRTWFDQGSGCVVVTVGARGNDWGRLVVITGEPPTSGQLVTAERAATTLALHRLVEREQESLERQSHRTLLAAMVDQSLTSQELLVRAAGVGVPLEDRSYVAVTVRALQRPPAGLAAQAQLRQLAQITEGAMKAQRSSALVGVLDETSVGALLVLPLDTGPDPALEAISRRIRREAADVGMSQPVVAAGSTVTDLLDVRRSFLESLQVADVADPTSTRSVHRLADVGLAGLLHLLREDERLQAFVERELGPLLAYDARHESDLLGALRTYLACGRNKSLAAERYGLSRPSFYERLRGIEALLDVDLDEVSVCLTLHVAVSALEFVRQGFAPRP